MLLTYTPYRDFHCILFPKVRLFLHKLAVLNFLRMPPDGLGYVSILLLLYFHLFGLSFVARDDQNIFPLAFQTAFPKWTLADNCINSEWCHRLNILGFSLCFNGNLCVEYFNRVSKADNTFKARRNFIEVDFFRAHILLFSRLTILSISNMHKFRCN